MNSILTLFYGLCALLLAVYTLGHGVLLIQYWRHRSDQINTPLMDDAACPPVTVQLPVYNERRVVRRLIEAVTALDYPADKLHIQILDDSTDVTSQHIAHMIGRFPHLRIDHIRRRQRTGYKAGALAYGLAQTASPLVAIFDADFVPPPDFLRRTVPFMLADDRLAVVQTRWGHLNPDTNGLTRAQVLSIDTHFLVEQTGRSRSGWPLPFNGTGGVWRVAAIADAGGWSDATLTEDLDLSFRAQMRGWKSLFLPDVIVPGELPPQLAAYRQQQARWAQGSAQCLRRLLLMLWRSDLNFSSKITATQHLFQYMPHVLMLVMLLLAPVLILSDNLHTGPLASLGLIGLIPPLMYAAGQYDSGGNWFKRLLAFPLLLLIGTGMIWNNTRSVLVGLFHLHTEFRRTPKFVEQWTSSDYALQFDATVVMEILLMLYTLWAAWLAWNQERALVPYLLIHAASFGMVIAWDTIDQWRIARAPLIQPLPETGQDQA